MIIKRSNARATSKNPWLTQPRRQFPHAARLNFTPSERLPERRPRTSPQPGQSPARFYISRRLKQTHPSRLRTRWRLRCQLQMREDAGDGGRILDGRDELQLPAAVRAAPDVDIEHALQQLRPNACAPSHSRPAGGRKRLRAPVRSPSAVPAPPPCAVSRSVPAPHESGSDAVAVAAPARPGAA